MRFPHVYRQLRRAQLIFILAVLVPTVLMTAVGILLLALRGSESVTLVGGILVLAFCTTTITGYILGSMFVVRGAAFARLQNDFLSSVSHELRTPLTSLNLFIESLRDGRLAPDDQQKVLNLLGSEVKRLDKLVGRLLELSRMDAGVHAFERARIEVVELVADAMAAFNASTLDKPTPVEIDIEPHLTLVGDRAALARALSNLLVNAWKYSGANKRIRIEARGSGRIVEIAVRDNGIGVPPSERREIFEEFSRGKRAVDEGTPGIGLGLSIVRAIVRAHRGSIEAGPGLGGPSGEPHGGSSFTLRLPRGRPSIIVPAPRANENAQEP